MSLLNKKVKILRDEKFGPLITSTGEYIGTAICYRDSDYLVRLLPQFHGWGQDHPDFERFNLEQGYTYWWINEKFLDLEKKCLMETE